jgi:hypothetical protein
MDLLLEHLRKQRIKDLHQMNDFSNRLVLMGPQIFQ